MARFEKRRRKALAAAVSVGLSGWLALPALASSGSTPAVSTGSQRLAADVLPGLSLVAPSGPARASQVLDIGVGLSLPGLDAAKAYEQSEYDPSSPNYHHFLTPAQFDSMFGVPAQTYDRVVSWLRSGGLTIDQTTGAGDWVAASGTVGRLDRLFSTTIEAYSLQGVSFVANTTAPMVPAGDSILTVVGLNTLQRFSTPKDPAAAVPASETAPSLPQPPGCLPACDYGPSDLWSMYDMPANNTGQGQSVAIFGEGSTSSVISDLRDFENYNKLPQVPVTVKDTGPGPFTDTSGQEEWDIDTQASSGMAPGLYNIDLYFANSLYDASVETLFTQWVKDDVDKQANASFGECETNPTNPVTGPLSQQPYGSELGDELEPVAEATLLQATVQGQTLFASAGDTGSSCPVLVLPVVGAGNGVANQGVPFDNYPCASDYAVCVGGTVLWSDGNTPPRRAIERAWEFTGGGAAPFQAEPSFQKGDSSVDIPCAADYSTPPSPFPPGTICRGAPDVAAMSGDVSDNGYNIYDDGAYSPGLGGGTSLSSPLWVGMWSRVQAAAPGVTLGNGTVTYPGLGFADPTIYKTAENAADYAKDFFDITLGDNGVYHAAPGWDYVSGWGVPDVTNLMTTIDGTTTPANDIMPPAPPPPSTGSCNALWINQAHTATDLFGNSDPQLTLLEGNMAPGPNGTLAVTLTVENLSDSVPPGATGADWYMTWTYGGTEYFAQAQIGPVPTLAPTFDDGTVQKVGTSSQYNAAHTDTGKFVTGKDGTIEIDVPLANIGNPASGAVLNQPAGVTYIEVGVPPNPTGAGVASLQQVDTGGPTNNYDVGTTTGTSGCTLPE
jgi:pseudomonalisin